LWWTALVCGSVVVLLALFTLIGLGVFG
jgi:hypothetical protein